MINPYASPGMHAVLVDELILNVCGARGAAADADWRGYIDWLKTVGANPKVAATFTPFSTPTPAQRNALTEAAGDTMSKMDRVMLYSDSTFVRGAMTAMSWIVRSQTQIRSLRPSAFDDGLVWLGEKARFERKEAHAALVEILPKVGLSAAEFSL